MNDTILKKFLTVKSTIDEMDNRLYALKKLNKLADSDIEGYNIMNEIIDTQINPGLTEQQFIELCDMIDHHIRFTIEPHVDYIMTLRERVDGSNVHVFNIGYDALPTLYHYFKQNYPNPSI